jgi:hypothetical protein
MWKSLALFPIILSVVDKFSCAQFLPMEFYSASRGGLQIIHSGKINGKYLG